MEMTIQEAIAARHSVRAYKGQPLTAEVVKALEDKVAELNREGRLHMQLIQTDVWWKTKGSVMFFFLSKPLSFTTQEVFTYET